MCGPDTKCIEFKSSTRNNNPLSALALHTNNNYHQYGPKKKKFQTNNTLLYITEATNSLYNI